MQRDTEPILSIVRNTDTEARLPADPAPWDADSPRSEIIERFTAWLDTTLASEAPPRGLAADVLECVEGKPQPAATGDYPLWVGMTALTQEVKLQSRTFSQLKDVLAPLDQQVATLLEGQEVARAEARRIAEQVASASEDRLRQARKAGEDQARQDNLATLLDVRDRLARGLSTAMSRRVSSSPEPGWLDRLLGKQRSPQEEDPVVAALLEGYSLSLERLNASLTDLGVEEMPCQDKPFDPARMKAVATLETSQSPEGTVLEVYRPGYLLHGEVYRQADVRVSKRPVQV